MGTTSRIVAHVDMDAFYAAIEVRDNPRYQGTPVVIGAAPYGRGVVAAASYEARRYGIRSAMPSREAFARCAHAVFLPPDMDKYRAVSEQLFELLETFTPQIEPISIDEAFLDLTGCPVPEDPRAPVADGGRGADVTSAPPAAPAPSATAAPPADHDLKAGLAIARAIKTRIHEVLHLPSSLGVAPNKFLAKLASELAKPDGLRGITPSEIGTVLDPLPVTMLWGVGQETRERLERLGIRTIGALRRTPPSALRASLGFIAEHLVQLSRGIDSRRVEPPGEGKSLGRETTFEHDTRDPEVIARTLMALVGDVARRLRAEGLLGQTVTLKVRYEDFRTITRSATLAAPVDTASELYRAVERMRTHLAPRTRTGTQRIRLLGISVSRLGRAAQLDLFGRGRRQGRVDRVVDSINERFGDGTVRPARLSHGRGSAAGDPASGRRGNG
jgi:DNA polymerase-4